MMHRVLAITAALGLATLGACSKGEEKASQAKTTAAPTPPTPEAPKPVDEAPKPAEAAPADPAKLLADLEKCTSDIGCEAFDALKAHGPGKVTEPLVALASDPAKPADARRVAAKLLVEAKDPKAGMTLFEAAKKESDSMLRRELFEAAGAGGSPEVFQAASAYIVTKEGEDQEIEVRSALKGTPAESVKWAAAELPKAKRGVIYADVLWDNATAADVETLKGLLGKAKDPMVRHRLAAKLVQLGDATQLEVLYKGLALKDDLERADAANYFAEVADKIPDGDKEKVVKLLKDGKAADKSGLPYGYNSALTRLGVAE